MNANTAMKIREAVDQAVWCGESIPDIVAHFTEALLDAERRLAEAHVKEAKANLDSLPKCERCGLEVGPDVSYCDQCVQLGLGASNRDRDRAFLRRTTTKNLSGLTGKADDNS
jgi:hypothetical protein